MNVPEPIEPLSPPKPAGPAPHAEYAKVTYLSKTLPRAAVHTAKAGIKDVPKLGPGLGGQSPRTPHSPPASLGSLQPVLSPPQQVSHRVDRGARQPNFSVIVLEVNGCEILLTRGVLQLSDPDFLETFRTLILYRPAMPFGNRKFYFRGSFQFSFVTF